MRGLIYNPEAYIFGGLGDADFVEMRFESKKNVKDDVSEAVHSAVRDFFDVGLADQETMRKFDKSCLTAITPFSPEDISGLRAKEGVSQGVFAHYLNVRPKLVSEWERGTKTPSGPSLKLLSLVREKGLNAIR